MTKPIKIIVLVLLGSLLLLLRMFENELFYDPLLSFFKSDINSQLPDFNLFKLLANVTFRFVLNTLISLTILWIVFKDKGIIKLSGFLYIVFFTILMIVFSCLLFYSESERFLPLFYVRRFLIQPIFLLVLLPAFYFQRKKGSS